MSRSSDSARTSSDPARTRILSERWGSWVLPHWLERQADPASPAFVPAPESGGVTNSTVLDRVPIGVLDGVVAAAVDPRGLVALADGAWSIDWWVGADDRWHLPCREVAVRQSLIDDAPVVETTMRVPGGDIVHRVWAFRESGAGDVLAIEIENASKLPVALAIGVRPCGLDGAGRIGRIEVRAGQVLVDGDAAIWLPKAPSRLAMSTLMAGDAAEQVVTGRAGSETTGVVECAAGFATAGLVFPLPHTASVRLMVPLGAATVDAPPEAVPPADAVARGWAAHASRGIRVELPDSDLFGAFRAASAQVLLAAGGRVLAGDGSTTQTAAIISALDRLGLHEEAGAIVATLPSGQGVGGRLGGTDPSSDATSAALVAGGRHWRLARDANLAAEIAGPLAAGAHLHRRTGLRALGRRPAGLTASLTDLGWRVRGILDVVESLGGGGQSDAATELLSVANDARDQLNAEIARTEPSVEVLQLVALGVVDPNHRLVESTLELVRARQVHDGAVVKLTGATGLSPELTALLGRTELRRGEVSAMQRIDWFVRSGGPTRTWPALVHPRLGTGCGGDGWSPVASAACVELVLDLLAHEAGAGTGLVLCPVWPEGWLGAGLEVHEMPTAYGVVSFAVRWHGERPALLWELAPHPGVGPVTLTIPGLDPTWTSSELRGDALLAAPVAHQIDEVAQPGPVEGESFA